MESKIILLCVAMVKVYLYNATQCIQARTCGQYDQNRKLGESILSSINSLGWWWWWCNDVGLIFFLPEHHSWPCPSLYDRSGPILWWAHRGWEDPFQACWTWQQVHRTQTASTVIRSRSNWEMWWNVRFESWMCSQKTYSNCMMPSCWYGPSLWRMFPKPCWLFAANNSGTFKSKRGSNVFAHLPWLIYELVTSHS